MLRKICTFWQALAYNKLLNIEKTLTDLQGALAGGGQRQRQVHKGLKCPWLAVAGQTLHSGLELALEQRYNDGLVQQLVFAPGQVGCRLIVQMVIFLLLVPLPVVRLTPRTWKQHIGKQGLLQLQVLAKPAFMTHGKYVISIWRVKITLLQLAQRKQNSMRTADWMSK